MRMKTLTVCADIVYGENKGLAAPVINIALHIDGKNSTLLRLNRHKLNPEKTDLLKVKSSFLRIFVKIKPVLRSE